MTTLTPGAAAIVTANRTHIEGVRDMVTRLRAANREANDAIRTVGHSHAQRLADDIAAAGAALGRIEGRNLSDNQVMASGASTVVTVEAVFGGRETFTGGATTSLLVRPYEFGSASGSITVKRAGKTYTRAFPRNANPDGRVVFPMAKARARAMVSAIAGAVYYSCRIALGEPGWVQVSPRG